MSFQLPEQLKNPEVAMPLLAAALAGTAGGALTAMGPKKNNETRGSRRMRILRNALLAAGVGGGGTALVQQGARQFSTALPKEDIDPTTSALQSTMVNPVTRTAIGAGGVGAGLLHTAKKEKGLQAQLARLLGSNNGNEFPGLKDSGTDAAEKLQTDGKIRHMKQIMTSDSGLRDKALNTLESQFPDRKSVNQFVENAGIASHIPAAGSGKIRKLLGEAGAHAGVLGNRVLGIGRHNFQPGRLLKTTAPVGVAAFLPEILGIKEPEQVMETPQ